ncbi:hypothetical protein Stsp01_12700 [Streptomyces sp. NBRC 13847]|uniref:hypothetical protein n=1 Tax=Streptomyces TaxID=1883 RepID=UPI0024A180C6|nr:hypothetical protein [Streptomyces sp. NBRC 13847]GLW14527.1 hypothetical protein Stsp01_12700 [Streptomyces sp. NBRC 13847]
MTDSALPVPGNLYRFKCKKNGTYWREGIFDESPEMEYVLFQVSSNPRQYLICLSKNKYGADASGNFVATSFDAAKKPFLTFSLPSVPAWHDNRQTLWEIKEDGGGHFRLRSPFAGAYLCSGPSGFANLTESKQADGSDLFTVEETGSFPAVLKIEHVQGEAPPTPVLKSMNQPPEYEPEEPGKLTGVAAVPYFLIKSDAGKGERWQGRNSPYYIIKRWTRWHRVGWGTFAAGKMEHYGWSTTEGVTESQGKSISETTHMSVTANAGFALEGFSAGISGTLSHDLNVTTTTDWTANYSHTVNSDTTITPNTDEAIGTWYRQDKYVIYRADGDSDVIDFPVTVPQTKVESSYAKR